MKSVICPICGMHVCFDDVYNKDRFTPIRCQYCGEIVVEPDECFSSCDTIDFDELTAEDIELMLDLENL